MLKEIYTADAGTIQIQCGDSNIGIDNNYGDGQFKAYRFDSGKEFENYKIEHYSFKNMNDTDYKFSGIHHFTDAHVLNYDCFEPGKDRYFIFEKKTLFTLNGTFAIYDNQGKVYFVKHNDGFKEYKKKLIASLNEFRISFENLKEVFDLDDFDCNNYICDNYPFDKSFSELNISDWIDSIIENLKKGEKR